MRSRLESLDLLANNIANVGTHGYKADREFYNLYRSTQATPGGPTQPDVERNWIDYSQGRLEETHKPLDVALEGRGFFIAESPGGPVYTRNGSFRVSLAGVLETQEGWPVRAVGRDAAGKPNTIKAPPGSESTLVIEPDGTVRSEGQALGRLDLADFARNEALSKRGSGYFRLAGVSQIPSQAAEARVHQGRLESSNVAPAEAAVRLVTVMRQFEMLQRALVLGGEMNRKAVEEVAKVS